MTDPDWNRAEDDGFNEWVDDDALRRGLEDSAAGRVTYLGDFSKFQEVLYNIKRGEEEISEPLTEEELKHDFSDLEEDE